MRDVVTPQFKKLQNQGIIINNPMSRTTEVRARGTGTLLFSNPRSGGTQTAYSEMVNNPLSQLDLSVLAGRNIPSYDSALREARTRALSSVARPDFQGLVSLGELRESLSYLRNPLRGAVKLANALEWRIGRLYINERRAAKRRPPVKDVKRSRLDPDDARIVKELEGILLEFRYGVRPMIQEITSALENVRERVIEKPKRQTFRAKQLQTDTDMWVAPPFTAFGFRHVDTFNYARTVSINAGLLYEFTTRASLGEKWGLSLDQVPAAMWALTPLSFIVDWGANVGQFISALSPVPGSTQLASWYSVKVVHELSRTTSAWFITDPAWATGQTVTGAISPDTYTLVTYERVPNIGYPGLVIKANVLDTLSDPLKILDLSAIFHQKVANAMGQGRDLTNAIQRRTGRPLAAHKWFG
jgi:hypothetical protein